MTHSFDLTTLHILYASRSNRIKVPQAWSALTMYVNYLRVVQLAQLQIFLPTNVSACHIPD